MIHVRTNIAQSVTGDESNHAIAAGLDGNAKLTKKIHLGLGLAYGSYKNDSSGDAQMEPMGILGKLNVTIQPGFGKGSVDVASGNWKDDVANPDYMGRLVFGSVKYDIPVKNLIIQPRVRVWHYSDNTTDDTGLKMRPELSFTGKF